MINIWAHRGNSYRYPENTLSAFRSALDWDITGIELDIQLTKDREIVVIHDETVDRTTDHTGDVCAYTLAQLQSFHIRGDENEHIPTMREVLELMREPCRKTGVLINIELKNSVVRYEGMEEMILKMVAEYGLQEYVIYSSFNHESCALLKKMDPSLHVGVLDTELSKCLETAEEIEADALHPFIKTLDVDRIRERTLLPVRAWNIMEYEPFYPDPGECEVQDTEELEKTGVTDIFTNAPENYCRKRKESLRLQEYELYTNTAADRETGKLTEAEGYSVNREPVKLQCGDELCFETGIPEVFFYEEKIPEELIYTYTYDTEGNWTAYKKYHQPEEKTFTVKESGYYRFVYHGGEGDTLADRMTFHGEPRETVYAPWFQEECRKTAETVRRYRQIHDRVYLLVTDTHYAAGCVWPESLQNMKMLSRQIHPDAVIHLGDLTDGNMPGRQTEKYAGYVTRGLSSLGIPVYLCVGNHDRNAFRGNPERYSEAKAASLYLHRSKTYYYRDDREEHLRMIFLDSFDPEEEERYGYSARQVRWLVRTLLSTPRNFRILLFSHVPLSAEHHVWSDTIRNGEKILKILGYYQKYTGRILGMFHGHNHAEEIYRHAGFPVISLGCNKLEYFEEHKPSGSHTYERKQGTVSQELFDVLIVHQGTYEMDLIRFGAGEDRKVSL